jgi:hypothetical protein
MFGYEIFELSGRENGGQFGIQILQVVSPSVSVCYQPAFF